MPMSADFRDRLKASVADGRVYRDERPQKSALPAVRLQVVSDPRPVTHDGDQSLRDTLVQADCFGADRGSADELAEAVIAAVAPAGAFGSTAFSRSFVEGSRAYSDRADADRPGTPSADSGAITYVTSLDLRVWHQPA